MQFEAAKLGASSQPRDKKSNVPRVPGEHAPVINVLTLWSSMTRWLLSSSTIFSAFVHSYLHSPPPEVGGTTQQIWPIPAPYKEGFVTSGSERGVDRAAKARRKAVNLAVLSLSWLHLGKPRRVPLLFSRFNTLSSKQWGVVRRLESYLTAVEEVGDVGPKEMGRTSVRMEGLESLLRDLHGTVVGMAATGYTDHTVSSEGTKKSALRRGFEQTYRGEVVGTMTSGTPVLAKEIDASRLSFPKEKPEFNPAELFDEPHKTVFLDPVKLANTPDFENNPPPKVHLRATHSKALELLHFLDHHHRLRIVPEHKIRKDYCCGAFALVKDAAKDRLILDARPPNTLEATLTDWCSTLASVQALAQQELLPGFNMFFNGTDLRDYYYCFRVTSKRSYRNVFNFPLTIQQARTFHCFQEKMAPAMAAIFYPCLATLAMGDNQAVELGQKAHVKLGLAAGAFDASELITSKGKAPRGPIAAGIIIDDLLICEQRQEGQEVGCDGSEGGRRLGVMCEAYLRSGLTAHPAKTFRETSCAECWGITVDGVSGHVRANPKRLVPLLHVTAQVAKLGFSTVALLEVLSGSWVSILQVKRRMLSLLEHIYFAQVEREQTDIVKLSPALIQELWLLVFLGPMAVSNMRASSQPEVFLSDASEDCMASVRAKIPAVFARELQRHCLTKGTWAKMLTPWQRWLKQHGQLAEQDELPEGVPLVSHPVWLLVSQFLKFQLHHKKVVFNRRHINLLELESVLEVERRLAMRLGDARYLLGADSQVTLAVLTKGRSSSPKMNELLQGSLPTLLGAGLVGNYGFVPSLANVADDPTRHAVIRGPSKAAPAWWHSACAGDFSELDEWLGSIGYDPITLSGVPFEKTVDANIDRLVGDVLEPLREVQKPERLARFNASTSDANSVSPLKSMTEEGEKIERREQEPEGQTKKAEKMSEGKNEPGPPVSAVVSSQVAPPAGPPKKVRNSRKRSGKPEVAENQNSPLLSKECQEMLAEFPGVQFYAPGGRRADSSKGWQRRGFLDLYSGASGYARFLSKTYNVWVLTFDFDHGANQDLLDANLQSLIFRLMRAGCFLGVSAAPECRSFSRAVTPAVRDAAHPYGKPNISQTMLLKVTVGNQHASFVFAVIRTALELNLHYWVENPDGSFLWLLPPWVAAGYARPERAYRFDMCVYHTPWRKRTRICTSTGLAGRRELCNRNHQHIPLRGRSLVHKACWTRVAQVYPSGLVRRLAHAMARGTGLCAAGRKTKFSLAACAKCGEQMRIGEAKNPGPRRKAPFAPQRDPHMLLDTPLVSGATRILQDRVWGQFQQWLESEFSEETRQQIFLCAPLAVQVLRRFGLFLFQHGGKLYELRHLYVVAQQRYAHLRAAMQLAWQLVSQWEEIEPVVHRRPLPEILYQAMISIALMWKWKRFAGCLILAVEGIARIGEVLRGVRADLVLPRDQFDGTLTSGVFLQIRRPKSLRRGKGRIQHIKVDNADAVHALDSIFGELCDFLGLWPHSASAFRNRWDKILLALQLPKEVWPTPASCRGGGAIIAYKRGEPIANILWRMRLMAQSTLESYLQELAAENYMVGLPSHTKRRIKHAASLYAIALRSLV